MTTFNHNQQRSAQGRAGEARRAAVHPAHICVDHDNNWSASCRAGLELSRQDVGFRGSDRTGGIAMLPVHLTRTAGGWCINAQRRRLVAYPPGRPAAALQFSAALLIGRSHQLNRISDKPGSDLAYPFHSISPSCWSHVPHSGTCHRGRTINWVTRTK